MHLPLVEAVPTVNHDGSDLEVAPANKTPVAWDTIQ